MWHSRWHYFYSTRKGRAFLVSSKGHHVCCFSPLSGRKVKVEALERMIFVGIGTVRVAVWPALGSSRPLLLTRIGRIVEVSSNEILTILHGPIFGQASVNSWTSLLDFGVQPLRLLIFGTFVFFAPENFVPGCSLCVVSQCFGSCVLFRFLRGLAAQRFVCQCVVRVTRDGVWLSFSCMSPCAAFYRIIKFIVLI